ncbi:DUF1700 domain-containing protein [Acholeplasma granularum]|uniref:DUF1700 domain-containing protein n=1 Tax=Acholeplasma granularum TaxID=264635 RepID=UPI000470D656|nr:hypothetical protein [Acholeplasma granularum]
MEKLLAQLEQELKKKNLYKEEIDEILAYYEEIISDRYENGEAMNRIIESYDIKLISRLAFPQALQKREVKTSKEVSKNVKGLIFFLFSIPILIPLGVLYIAFIITVGALFIAGLALALSGVLGLIVLVFQLINSGTDFASMAVITGAYLFVITIAAIVLYYLTIGFTYVVKKSVVVISKVVSGGNKNENIR